MSLLIKFKEMKYYAQWAMRMTLGSLVMPEDTTASGLRILDYLIPLVLVSNYPSAQE